MVMSLDGALKGAGNERLTMAPDKTRRDNERKAALFVLSRASSAQEAAEILDVLGLTDVARAMRPASDDEAAPTPDDRCTTR